MYRPSTLRTLPKPRHLAGTHRLPYSLRTLSYRIGDLPKTVASPVVTELSRRSLSNPSGGAIAAHPAAQSYSPLETMRQQQSTWQTLWQMHEQQARARQAWPIWQQLLRQVVLIGFWAFTCFFATYAGLLPVPTLKLNLITKVCFVIGHACFALGMVLMPTVAVAAMLFFSVMAAGRSAGLSASLRNTSIEVMSRMLALAILSSAGLRGNRLKEAMFAWQKERKQGGPAAAGQTPGDADSRRKLDMDAVKRVMAQRGINEAKQRESLLEINTIALLTTSNALGKDEDIDLSALDRHRRTGLISLR